VARRLVFLFNKVARRHALLLDKALVQQGDMSSGQTGRHVFLLDKEALLLVELLSKKTCLLVEHFLPIWAPNG
jgi:hypothetical protein